MPFTFSIEATGQIGQDELLIEDRRSNPVAGRHTVFRILQQNALAYTFPDFIPGFAAPGINRMPFDQLVARPTDNARAEGEHRFGQDFTLSQGQVAKIIGDVFELVEAAILWNAAAIWNASMAGEPWGAAPRYRRPSSQPAIGRQVAVLSLPRGYDWVRLLVPSASAAIAQIRERLALHDLTLPTSTPDILVVALPAANVKRKQDHGDGVKQDHLEMEWTWVS